MTRNYMEGGASAPLIRIGELGRAAARVGSNLLTTTMLQSLRSVGPEFRPARSS